MAARGLTVLQREFPLLLQLLHELVVVLLLERAVQVESHRGLDLGDRDVPFVVFRRGHVAGCRRRPPFQSVCQITLQNFQDIAFIWVIVQLTKFNILISYNEVQNL
jgi:hypothetical protein